MAPPGFAPPSYSQDGIPTRLVNKEAPPVGTDTNGRAYIIFFSYLFLAVSLTAFVIAHLRRSYSRLIQSHTPRSPKLTKHVRLYAVLAVWSVLVVWYYELQYFKISYQTWMRWRSYYDLTPDQMHWGLWLRETSLFREAWETAVVGNARYWWTHQIFLFACALGVSLEQTEVRSGTKHAWAFMLLGQIVSVGFATNLYLLGLLLSPSPSPAPTSTETSRRKWIGPWILSLLMILFTEGPAHMLVDEHYWHHQTEFLPMIIIPHIALLALPVARTILPRSLLANSSVEITGKAYGYLWAATISGGGLLFVRITVMAHGYSGVQGILDALLEAPAVSSVAFDVIFCWVSWGVWWFIQEQRPAASIKDKDGSEGMNAWMGRSSQAEPVREDSGVRRR